MTLEDNKAVVRRFFEIMNQGDLDRLREICSPDLQWHGGSMGDFSGSEAALQMAKGFYAAFPGMQTTIDFSLAEGDKVVAQFTSRGTQDGDFMGLPPSGKRVTVAGLAHYRIANGQIAEEWHQQDSLGLLQQLGALPGPAGS
jgi:steroid delta-isomerase-like uncharacterized protein